MTFNSVEFAALLGIAAAAHWLVVPVRYRNALLLVASYVFYGAWDARFLSLIALSTLVDYAVALRLDATETDRVRLRWLLTSVVVNLGILGFFKYANFFVDSFADVVGADRDEPFLRVVLPVGISFYTFQTMSYTFDVYRRRIPASRNLVDFATYVAYFPQLVAGPIERAQHLLPLIQSPQRRTVTADDVRSAFGLILLGLVRKVVIADGVAGVVDDAFDAGGSASALTLAAGVVAFGLQIYGDFAGYTDIARGVSRLFGIELMVNFAQPYLSRNVTEFWRRWHISLSTWLRDYLYVPLGGNRRGPRATYRNLVVTMVLGGLWHGAAWGFVVWGGLHGAFLAVHRFVRGGEADDGPVSARDIPSMLGTFGLVSLAWVFFRAASVTEAFDILAGIFSLRGGPVDGAAVAFVVAALGLSCAIDAAQRGLARDALGQRPVLVAAASTLSVLAVVVFSGGAPTPFIYFQF